jgi:hypothetical protein
MEIMARGLFVSRRFLKCAQNITDVKFAVKRETYFWKLTSTNAQKKQFGLSVEPSAMRSVKFCILSWGTRISFQRASYQREKDVVSVEVGINE